MIRITLPSITVSGLLKAKAKKIIKITPSEEEIDENNRSRSSKLRVIERIL